MLNSKRVIESGDMIIVYSGANYIDIVTVGEGKMYDSKHGHYYHNNFIGKEFGTKVFDNQNRGYVYILKPTSELWTLALNHRTEILYSADISLIIHHLELRPGSIVLESGTGSGSLSTAIARTIFPSGHLNTYEFHRGRADAAVEDFKKNNFDKLITVRCGDVCVDGFFDVMDESVDAVFLDLPCPWQAVPHAIKKLKPYSRLCSFSPCIEQVQQLCTALTDSGFVEIVTWECLLKPFDVLDLSEDLQPEEEADKKKKKAEKKRKRKSLSTPNPLQPPKPATHLVTRPVALMRGHTGYLTFAIKSRTPN
jgi:tRNA (adenine57-N1/adenine58-N1)-methyltransferase